MKKTILSITILFLISFEMKLKAQCGEYPEKTHTDPAINLSTGAPYALPLSGTFQQNTFDWTAEYFDYWYSPPNSVDKLCTAGAQSPFYQNEGYLDFIAHQNTSDFKPEDGWELIKQNFGYFYGSGYNGTAGSPCNTSPSPNWESGGNLNNPNGPTDGSYSSSLYFVLYNKYSGKLRVLASVPQLSNVTTNIIQIQLSFIHDDNGLTTNYDFFSYNGLFNHYNTKTYALDKQTNVTTVSAPAVFPSSFSYFFYADFQMAYDPCVCMFQSGFDVNFITQINETITMNGQFAGIVSPNINIADVNAGNAGSDGIAGDGNNGGNTPQNFIASVNNNGGSPTGMIQSYENLQSVYDQNIVGTGNDVANALGTLGGIVNFIAPFAIGDFIPNEIQLKDALDGTGKFLNFFSSQMPTTTNSPPPKPMVVSGYITLTGNINGGAPQTNSEFLLATPGSKDPLIFLTNDGSGKYSEYSAATTNQIPANSLPPNNNNPNPVTGVGPLPAQPIYNEPLGLFALLKTPKVNRFVYSPARPNTTSIGEINYSSIGNQSYFQLYYGDTPPLPSSLPSNVASNSVAHQFPASTTDYFRIEYNPAEDLVYALNPIVDVANSKIYVSYEIDGMPTNTTQGNFSDHSLEGFESSLLTNGNFARNKTQLYPIGCNTSIYTFESLNYTQNYIFEGDNDNNYCPNFLLSFGGTCPSGTSFKNTDVSSLYANSDLNLINNQGNVTLVVTLELVSLPDVYGNRHLTTQIIKYDCDIVASSTDYASTTAGENALISYPTNLNMNAYDIFGIGADINPTTYSYGTITISYDQPNETALIVNVIAQDGIKITAPAGQGVALTSVGPGSGGINLYTQEAPPYFNTCSDVSLSPVTSTNLTNYCSNLGGYAASGAVPASGYQANVRTAAPTANNTKGSPSVLVATPTALVQTKLGTNITLGIFPNPTSGVVYLNLSAQNAGSLFVNISDATGNAVMHTSYSAVVGANSYKLDLSTLNSGVYFINITDENGVTIKNDKLVLMGQ